MATTSRSNGTRRLGGRSVPALVAINRLDTAAWCGDLSVEKRAAMVATAVGTSGRCRDYVTKVRRTLQKLRLADPHVAAFAAAVTAYTGSLKSEVGLSGLFRFGIVPMFLFSGTFFPIEQLPDYMEPLAYATPLWHGVELCRGLALGLDFTVHPLVSVGYLAVWIVGGTYLAIRIMRGRLIS